MITHTVIPQPASLPDCTVKDFTAAEDVLPVCNCFLQWLATRREACCWLWRTKEFVFWGAEGGGGDVLVFGTKIFEINFFFSWISFFLSLLRTNRPPPPVAPLIVMLLKLHRWNWRVSSLEVELLLKLKYRWSNAEIEGAYVYLRCFGHWINVVPVYGDNNESAGTSTIFKCLAGHAPQFGFAIAIHFLGINAQIKVVPAFLVPNLAMRH